MDHRDKGIQTQLRNIEAQTKRSLKELEDEIASWGTLPHGQQRARLEATHGLSFVHADTLLLCLAQMRAGDAGDPLEAIYVGKKAPLRAVHDAFVAALAAFGPYEVAPKKGYVSLRRNKQFCMVGPGTKGRLAIGINARSLAPTARLVRLPKGKLCPLEVHLIDAREIDAELLGWLKVAFDEAG